MRKGSIWYIVITVTVFCATIGSNTAVGNSDVYVQSLTTSVNQWDTVGVFLMNGVDLRGVSIPLVIRSASGGAYPEALTGRYTVGGRLSGYLDEINYIYAYELEDGTCKSGDPGGFGTVAAVSGSGAPTSVPSPADPDALFFSRNKIVHANWPAGDDGTIPSIQIEFYSGDTPGAFIVDTTCSDPASHLYFVTSVGTPDPITFTSGTVTIEQSLSSVVVETKTTQTYTWDTIGVFLANTEALRDISVPLVIRSASGGAYPHAITGRYTEGGRLEGYLSDIIFIRAYENEDGTCKNGATGGFGTATSGGAGDLPVSVANPADPDAFCFTRGKIIGANWLAGEDGTTPSIQFEFYSGDAPGAFIVDTTCINPATHLLFVNAVGSPVPTNFTPGTITVEALPITSSSVTVESKNVNPNTSFDVRVDLANHVETGSVVVPLAIRSTVNGCYPTAVTGRFPEGSRVAAHLTDLIAITAYGSEDGNCKEYQAGGFGMISAYSYTGDPVSVPTVGDPDALSFRLAGGLMGAVLPVGMDGLVPSIEISFTVGSTEGVFVIDTTCTDPYYHLIYQDPTGAPIPVAFTPGTVIVGNPCYCPYQGDMDANDQLDAVDLNLAIGVYFFNAEDPQDPACPKTRADCDANGASDAVDLNALIQTLFFNGPDPDDPCE